MAASAGAQAGSLSNREAQRARGLWLALALCTVAFLVLCALSVVGIVGFIGNMTVPQVAKLQLRQGTQLSVLPNHMVAPELVSGSADVSEGDEVRTGDDTGAFIELFDGSTVQAYAGTQLRLEKMRSSRFFSNMKEASIFVKSGTLVLATAKTDGFAAANYSIATEDSVVDIGPDSKVRAEVTGSGDDAQLQIVVNRGSARLHSLGHQMELGPGSMALVHSGQPPEGPLPAEEDLIRNGSFTEPPTSGSEEKENGGLGIAGWLPISSQASDTPQPVPGLVYTTTEKIPGLGSVNAVVFERDAHTGENSMAGIRQDLNQPAEYLNSLELFATVKILSQSAPVGSPQGNIYPLTMRVVYTDSEGQSHEWRHAFYFEGGGVDPLVATKVPEGAWTETEHFVLKSRSVGRDIVTLKSIEIYGYGTQFQSWVTGVSMVAR